MSRRWIGSLLLGVLFLAGVLLAGAWTPPARAEASRPARVVLVSFAGITWEDVAAGRTPVLRSLAGKGSAAAMSLRTVGSRTDAASAFATIGAGNRALGTGGDNLESGPNTVAAPGGGLKVPAMTDVRSDNARLPFGAAPGTLGEMLHVAGLRTGVVGNADGGTVPSDAVVRVGRGRDRRRFAGLALADVAGRIDTGYVGDDLVSRDGTTLNGYRADPEAMLRAVRAALAKADVVLIELADTYREGRVAYARLETKVPTPKEDAPSRLAAIRRDDALLARILDELDLDGDTVFVLGTTGLGPELRDRLTVAIMAGVASGEGAWLTSSSTKREGIITIVDIAPSVLRLIGIEQPAAMTGQPVRSVPAPGRGRIARLVDLETGARFHSRWVGPFFVTFVLTQVALYLIAWGLLWGRARRRGARPVAGTSAKRDARDEGARRRVGAIRALTLAFMAAPLSTLVLAALRAQRWPGLSPALVLVSASAVVAFGALKGPWRHRASGPPAFVCALTAGAIALDLLTGGRLQMSSLIGYSPIVAGRFFGLGNLAFAVLGTSALLVASALAGAFGSRALTIVAGIGLVTVVVDGAPTLGADFGGLLSLVPAFGLLLVLVSGRKLSWRGVVALAAAGIGAALAAGLLDALRPAESQTHIGRFVTRLLEGGPAAIAQVIGRKASANWTLLTSSFLTLSIPIAVGFVAFVLMRPPGRLRMALETETGLKAGLLAAGLMNLLGFAVNDSGIAVPAMGLAIGVPYCLATVLAIPEADRGGALRRAEAPAGPVGSRRRARPVSGAGPWIESPGDFSDG